MSHFMDFTAAQDTSHTGHPAAPPVSQHSYTHPHSQFPWTQPLLAPGVAASATPLAPPAAQGPSPPPEHPHPPLLAPALPLRTVSSSTDSSLSEANQEAKTAPADNATLTAGDPESTTGMENTEKTTAVVSNANPAQPYLTPAPLVIYLCSMILLLVHTGIWLWCRHARMIPPNSQCEITVEYALDLCRGVIPVSEMHGEEVDALLQPLPSDASAAVDAQGVASVAVAT
jgi:hypothetical protein